jgi:hypothetical protein
VTATDGHSVDPIPALQSVIIFPGETMDVTAVNILDTHNDSLPAENFWIRAQVRKVHSHLYMLAWLISHSTKCMICSTIGLQQTLEVEHMSAGQLWSGQNLSSHVALGVLSYPGSPNPLNVDPSSQPRVCTAQTPCSVFNCPFPSYHPSDHTKCIVIDQARSAATSDTSAGFGHASDRDALVPDADVPNGGEVIERFLNFGFEPSINNRRFHYPEAPPLTQLTQANLRACDASECDAAAFPHEPCECTHMMDLPFNRTIQLVLTNLGIAGFGMHPVHLHGHSFQVLRIGMPPVFPETGSVCKWEPHHLHPTCLANDDVVCVNGTGCAKSSWRYGVPPQLNLHDRPVRKDTVIVPPGGYAVIRFRTDNPGWWHLHCHMAHHMQSGMAMLINEASALQGHFKPPKGFPQCGGFPDSAKLAKEVSASQAAWQQLLHPEPEPELEPEPEPEPKSAPRSVAGPNADSELEKTLVISLAVGGALGWLLLIVGCCSTKWWSIRMKKSILQDRLNMGIQRDGLQFES